MKKILKLHILLIAFSTVFFSCSSDDTPIVPEKEEQTTPDPDPDSEVTTSDKLPLFDINTGNIAIVDEPKVAATIKITEADEVTYEGIVGIEFRGSSSQLFPKKSFGLETWDANGEDINAEILGFPEEEDFILYAPYSDKSLMRNMFVYDVSRAMGTYASRTKFVELKLNNESQGVYVFMEKLKRDKNRIDISKLNDDENEGEDLTGGYILKIDKTSAGDISGGYNTTNSFRSSYAPPLATDNQNINFLYEYPDAEVITSQQKTYISDYVGAFEDALNGENFTDPVAGYVAYIDVDSFIDFFILNEVANNVDGYRISTFLQKDKNEKLKMGPIWDFNIAFGNADYCGGNNTNTWAYKFNERCPQDYWQIPFWWQRLLQDPSFVTQLKERWTTLRSGPLSTATLTGSIENYKQLLQKSGTVETNFEKWPVLGEYIWPNAFVGQSFEEEVTYFSTWTKSRLTWLDGAINGL